MAEEKAASYIPALRFRALTRLYDPVLALTVRERRFKQRLLRQAELTGPLDVLDLACGTGTLTVRAKRAAPQIEITGVDADPDVLGRARAKAGQAGLQIRFDEALSTELPYEKKSFDRVLSSLFFHHLDEDEKLGTLREVVRVLRPGGRLHVADWGKPSDPLMAALSLSIRALDGFEPTRANFEGRLPEHFAAAGLERVRVESSLRTVYGTLTLLSAVRP
jgi:ubiquinone/menaquinone biosynthesis C-methylase UbiE